MGERIILAKPFISIKGFSNQIEGNAFNNRYIMVHKYLKIHIDMYSDFLARNKQGILLASLEIKSKRAEKTLKYTLCK